MPPHQHHACHHVITTTDSTGEGRESAGQARAGACLRRELRVLPAEPHHERGVGLEQAERDQRRRHGQRRHDARRQLQLQSGAAVSAAAGPCLRLPAERGRRAAHLDDDEAEGDGDDRAHYRPAHLRVPPFARQRLGSPGAVCADCERSQPGTRAPGCGGSASARSCGQPRPCSAPRTAGARAAGCQSSSAPLPGPPRTSRAAAARRRSPPRA